MIPVRYMGQHAHTGSIIGLTKDGVKFGESANRLPVEDRWNPEGWDELRGLPWDLKPQQREAPADGTTSSPRACDTQMDFYVRRTDVEDFGPTPRCERCRTISLKIPPRGTHAESCRERMKARV